MKFEFRLEQVLSFRRSEAEVAKAKFLERRASRLEAEARLASLGERRLELLDTTVTSLYGHRELEMQLQAMDDQERSERAALHVLVTEEEIALAEWHDRQRDVEVIERLRQDALDEWRREEARREQASLDEWAVQRRKAA